MLKLSNIIFICQYSAGNYCPSGTYCKVSQTSVGR